VGVVFNPLAGECGWQPAPLVLPQMQHLQTRANRPIRLHTRLDGRFILDGFFAELARFARNDEDNVSPQVWQVAR